MGEKFLLAIAITFSVNLFSFFGESSQNSVNLVEKVSYLPNSSVVEHLSHQ
jgi:hypothetical protein